MNKFVAVLASAAPPEAPLVAAEEATKKKRPVAGPLVICTTNGIAGCDRAPAVQPALVTTMEFEVTELIVPEVRPETELSTSKRGMDIIVVLRAEPEPGVIVTVVNPTGSVATVVWALRPNCVRANEAAIMRRGRRCSFMLREK
jgi:hypothetical protein